VANWAETITTPGEYLRNCLYYGREPVIGDEGVPAAVAVAELARLRDLEVAWAKEAAALYALDARGGFWKGQQALHLMRAATAEAWLAKYTPQPLTRTENVHA
jgi:hypothetical protein